LKRALILLEKKIMKGFVSDRRVFVWDGCSFCRHHPIVLLAQKLLLTPENKKRTVLEAAMIKTRNSLTAKMFSRREFKFD
jgi:hypothetical protein